MFEEWLERKIRRRFSLRAIGITLGITFIILLFMPSQDIECSKAKNSCSIYTRTILSLNPTLTKQFRISDIDGFRIGSHRHRSRYSRYYSYSVNIYLKSGEKISLENETRSYERAQEICNHIANDDNYILKGNFWKSFRDDY